jgi:hypothetical protein
VINRPPLPWRTMASAAARHRKNFPFRFRVNL